MSVFVNTLFQDQDTLCWEAYRRSRSPADRDRLLKRFDGALQSQVNRWAGPVPREVLLNEAKLLAVKAFDSFDPKKGTALATHVVNNLLPLSRIVYTYQNSTRLPENTTMKLQTYNTAVEHLKAYHGREPTTDELHDELGWSTTELSRIKDSNRKNLIESGSPPEAAFYANSSLDIDEDLLTGIHAELLPDEKQLFEHLTGYNGISKLGNKELLHLLGVSQSVLSYRKSLLTRKVQGILQRYAVKKTPYAYTSH